MEQSGAPSRMDDDGGKRRRASLITAVVYGKQLINRGCFERMEEALV